MQQQQQQHVNSISACVDSDIVISMNQSSLSPDGTVK
jgi:hypothetical protein